MATSRVCIEDVDKANRKDIFKMCKDLNIERTEKDSLTSLKKRLKDSITIYSRTMQVPIDADEPVQQVQTTTIPITKEAVERANSRNIEKEKEAIESLKMLSEKFEKRKNTVACAYNELKKILEMKEVNETILSALNMFKRQHKVYKENIEKQVEDLEKMEITIVIAGETSAGKSSFLNLLLGADILPTSVLQCTGTICRLRHSSQKYITIEPQTGEPETIRDLTTSEFKETIIKYTRARRGESQDEVKYVDIYWPICMNCVTIVDTPGVADNEELAERLYDHLAQADAFIYVLNTPNAGGVQKDRILKIFEVQEKKLNREKGTAPFDTNATLFICNKWDQCRKEADEVFVAVYETLQKVWLDLEKCQLIRLSTAEELKKLPLKISHPLFEAFCGLLGPRLDSNILRHTRWISSFISAFGHIVGSMKIMNVLSEKDQQILVSSISEEIRGLERKQYSELCSNIQFILELIVKDLHTHLHSEATKGKLFNWIVADCPVVGKKADPVEVYTNIIFRKIQEEIIYWYNNADHQAAQRFKDIEDLFESHLKETECQFGDIRNRMYTIHGKIDQFKTIRHSQLSLKPVRLKSTFLNFLFRKFKTTSERRLYNTNRLLFMKHCSEKVMKQFTEEYINKYLIQDGFLEIKNQARRAILEKLNHEWTFLHTLTGMRKIENQKALESIFGKCQTLMETIQEFEAFVFAKPKLSLQDITELSVMRNGQNSTVSLVEVKEITMKFALKRYNEVCHTETSPRAEIALHTIREMEHDNVMKILGYGTDKTTYNSAESHLFVVMEYCSHNLEDIIGENPCGKMISPESCRKYVERTNQICSGIEYIHSKQCVHGCLSLKNILIRNGIIKIAEFGVVKSEDVSQLEGNCSRLAYVAPERFASANKEKLPSMDIYSLAIILWEMWYGVSVFHDHNNFTSPTPTCEFISFVSDNGRPRFYHNVPPTGFQDLLKSCWDGIPSKRPSITEISDTAKKYFTLP